MLASKELSRLRGTVGGSRVIAFQAGNRFSRLEELLLFATLVRGHQVWGCNISFHSFHAPALIRGHSKLFRSEPLKGAFCHVH
jgi:hypothetical protein